MNAKISRRDFMKLLGVTGASGALIGCDAPSMVNLEEGKEHVVSYLLPTEDMVPGLGVWYASMCLQCSAGCGVHGRVREGRPLKLEGNPESPINAGKSCQMGQAGLQAHYNPDRITQPLLRKKGQLVPSSWEEAFELISERVGTTSDKADRTAWFTGTISGHQQVLLQHHLQALNSKHHYAYEVVNTAVLSAVNKAMFADESPTLRLDKAELILSFGADFLGTWVSPVHFAGQFSKFRALPNRGSLIQVESKMSLTGANADLWVAAPPGSEGLLALGIANYLLNHGKPEIAQDVPQEIVDFVGRYDARKVAETTGVEYDLLRRIAKALERRSPSLVLAGAAVEGQEEGYAAVAAVQLLNLILGNIGKTIVPSMEFPLPQLQVKNGSTADLLAFSQAVVEKKLDVVFFHGANPLFNAPESLNLAQNLKNNVALKVALAQFPDETAMQADVVLPLSSHLEDWGTHVASYQPSGSVLGFQQPLMEPLHSETRGLGDVMLELLKMIRPEEYSAFKDYYAYLRNAVAGIQEQVADPLQSAQAFWQKTLSSGQIQMEGGEKNFSIEVRLADPLMSVTNESYPLMLVPSPRLGLFDGRHANLPWLQESPDQITKVVWDSWAELHPSTAEDMGIGHGDVIKVASESGSFEVKAYLTKSVHKNVVAVPLGQGHASYGRYAEGVGVNPLTILNLKQEKVTGELAMYATAVKLEKMDATGTLVRMGGTDSQQGRQFVRTVPTYKPQGV
ncbi:MAG: molybdopterin-dependent oxidoreductase [Gammaproteobacteria bacterium]|nr:molybdopterin-dependent oxidoreductase [Gammaproteobacteria bacterium]